jgi:hypothetical protein
MSLFMQNNYFGKCWHVLKFPTPRSAAHQGLVLKSMPDALHATAVAGLVDDVANRTGFHLSTGAVTTTFLLNVRDDPLLSPFLHSLLHTLPPALPLLLPLHTHTLPLSPFSSSLLHTHLCSLPLGQR